MNPIGHVRSFAAIAVAVALAAAALLGTLLLRDSRQPVDWTLIGTADDGRSIVVGFAFNGYRSCTRDVQARVRSRTRAWIDLAVDAEVGNCTDQAAAIIDPITVRLDRPLHGEAIRSESRSIRRLRAGFQQRWNLGTPQVIGLKLGDAQAVGAAFNLSVREVGVDENQAGYNTIATQRRVGEVLEVGP